MPPSSRRAARRADAARGPLPLVLLALAAVGPGLQAQAPVELSAVIVGRVAGDSAGTAVAGAQVVASGYGMRGDAQGRFTLAVPPGTHEIVARLPGRAPWRAVRTLAAGDTLQLDLVLAPLVQTLDEVTVTRRSRAASARFVEFERRRGNGSGHFKTRDELARRENSKLSDVLRGVPGLRFHYLPHGRGIALATNRFSGNLPGSRRRTNECFMALWVDGVRVFEPSSSENSGAAPIDPPNINGISVDDLEGIEVYRGPAETPAEFGGTNAMCGTVVLWTRAGR